MSAAILTISGADPDDWKSYKGSNFEIKYTSHQIEEVEEIARTLEAIQKLFPTILPELKPQHDFKCIIKLYSKVNKMNSEIKRDIPSFNLKVNGVYFPTLKTLYTIPESAKKDYTTYNIVKHEFFHFYTDTVYDIVESHLPGWIKEGMAVYFAGIELNKEYQFDKMVVPAARVRKVIKGMERQNWAINIKSILIPYQPTPQNYTVAWTVCKFLIESDAKESGKYRKFLAVLLEELKEHRYDKSLKKALRESGTTLEQMDADWKSYLNKLYEDVKADRSEPDENEGENEEDSETY
jgi:hypothetical protein